MCAILLQSHMHVGGCVPKSFFWSVEVVVGACELFLVYFSFLTEKCNEKNRNRYSIDYTDFANTNTGQSQNLVFRPLCMNCLGFGSRKMSISLRPILCEHDITGNWHKHPLGLSHRSNGHSHCDVISYVSHLSILLLCWAEAPPQQSADMET